MVLTRQLTATSLTLWLGLALTSNAFGSTSDRLTKSMCDGYRTGISAMTDAYEERPTNQVSDTLMTAFDHESHEPTREFLSEVIAYTINQGDRGRKYLQSDNFMKSCLAVMNQKLANMKATLRTQRNKLKANTDQLIGNPSHHDALPEANHEENRWQMSGRR